MADFRLFETMLVSEGGEIALLERHLDRLRKSARYFSFKCDSTRLRQAAVRACRSELKAARLRLTLSDDGAFEAEIGPVPANTPSHLMFSQSRVNSKDPFLYHKTTNRRIYTEPDVVLINERGELTETTIANIAVLREGCWLTPPILCGLLPGVFRAELLARGEIVETVIRADELCSGELIRCFNALRGVFHLPIFGQTQAG